jgi:hypothetical protein
MKEAMDLWPTQVCDMLLSVGTGDLDEPITRDMRNKPDLRGAPAIFDHVKTLCSLVMDTVTQTKRQYEAAKESFLAIGTELSKRLHHIVPAGSGHSRELKAAMNKQINDRVTRVNPVFKVLPGLWEAKAIPHLQEDTRQWLRNNTDVMRRLGMQSLASLFYLKILKLDPRSFTGEICCKIGPADKQDYERLIGALRGFCNKHKDRRLFRLYSYGPSPTLTVPSQSEIAQSLSTEVPLGVAVTGANLPPLQEVVFDIQIFDFREGSVTLLDTVIKDEWTTDDSEDSNDYVNMSGCPYLLDHTTSNLAQP